MGSVPNRSRPIVLIVEDEPLLLMNAVDMVESAGFEAVEARHADEAMRILQARSDIRIVFTDIHMPGSMDGLKLAAAVRNGWPPVEIIVTSGQYSPEASELPERSVFFSKPYDAARVTEAMHRFVN